VIRILVVDDHPIVRDGLVAVLEDRPDFQVAGAAGSVEEAVAMAERLDPDLVLLDLELPDRDGVEAIPELTAKAPNTRVLVFTAYDNDEHVFGAIKAGAKGYLLKGATGDEIARAIRIVHGGGSHLEPRVAAKVLAEVGSPQRSKSRLSGREREVLRLVANGLANKQIAASLGITERTVKFHVTSILNKLGADNRAQAAALAVQQGLL
jgi:DNA-binding NarL/FixJ family response regulator